MPRDHPAAAPAAAPAGERWALAYHALIWALAAALYGLLWARWLRVAALDCEALIVNLYQIREARIEWVAWARTAILYGAAPLLIAGIAGLIYRVLGGRLGLRSPLPRLGAGARAALGVALAAPYLAFVVPFSFGLSLWVAIEWFWWIEWYGALYDTMNVAIYRVPLVQGPALVLIGAALLRWALGRPADGVRRGGWAHAGRVGRWALGLLCLIALTPAAPHAAKLATAADSGTFARECNRCHWRTRPLYFTKTATQWRRTVTRMREFEGAPITETQQEQVLDFLGGARSYSDRTTFRTRCQRCHRFDVRRWDDRAPADWARIVDDVARWSTYYYSPYVKEQLVAHLTAEHGDVGATLGLDAGDHTRYRDVAEACGSCHSLSIGEGRPQVVELLELRALVERMEQRRGEPWPARDRERLVTGYHELMGDPTLRRRLFPHDAPPAGWSDAPAGDEERDATR